MTAIPEGRIEQIRRAHASARPTHQNPAWMNTHQDLGVVLAALSASQQEVERLQQANAAMAVVGEIVMDDGCVAGVKEYKPHPCVCWRGEMPPVGTKLYATEGQPHA